MFHSPGQATGTIAGVQAGVQAGEQTALMPLPPAFDGFVEQSKRVSPTCPGQLRSQSLQRCVLAGLRGPIRGHGSFAPFANRPVSLRICPERIVVVAEGKVLCEHDRPIQRSHHLPARTICDWRHDPAVIQRKAPLSRFAGKPLPIVWQGMLACPGRGQRGRFAMVRLL